MTKRKVAAGLAAWAGALAGACSPCPAAGLNAAARALSAAAAQAGVRRVAVLPFAPADGGDPAEGAAIAERLLTRLVRRGELEVVERSQIGRLLAERRLALSGLVDPATAGGMGLLIGADAIVTGSFARRADEIVLEARVVDAETGLVVAAAQGSAPRDWPAADGRRAPPELDLPRWLAASVGAPAADAPAAGWLRAPAPPARRPEPADAAADGCGADGAADDAASGGLPGLQARCLASMKRFARRSF